MELCKIARLASLYVPPEEMEETVAEFERIRKMVAELPEYEEMPDREIPMELREDTVMASGISQEEMLRNAPQVQDGCIVVPKAVNAE